MNAVEDLSAVDDNDVRLFRLFCERAVAVGNLQAPIDVQDVASASTLETLGSGLAQSLIFLIEQGWLDRAGMRRYAVTTDGFQRYARSYVDDYGSRANAVMDAVAAVEGTDTDAVMASTGETRLMVNHVLTLLQRDRAITGFLTESKGYCVTRVSPAFKQDRDQART